MADKSIQNDFIEGIYEVYSIMFTDGKSDGIYFYPLHTPNKLNVYREEKFKKYKKPSLLVAKVSLTPTQGEDARETIKGIAKFTVPFKSLIDNNIDVSYPNLEELRKGVVLYKDTLYEIDNINPSTFLEDTFMTYVFECSERVGAPNITVVLEEEDSLEFSTEDSEVI